MPQVQDSGFQPLSATLSVAGAIRVQDRAVQRVLRDGVAEALGAESRGRGMAGLAQAIRARLISADGKTDAVPSVLETINRALDDAAAKLAADGVSQEQIDAGLARFRQKLSRELVDLVEPANVEKSAIAAREVVRERFSLDVLTAEGDKVSIRFKSLSVTDVAAARISSDGAVSTAFEASVITGGRFKVEVDGDLNDTERVAIANLLDQFDGIAAEFFGGDVQAAFAAASRVGLESEALSAFDLKLSYSRSFAAAQAYASNAKAGSQPALKSSPTPVEPVTLPPEIQAPVVAATVEADATPVTAAPASEGDATSPALAAATAKAATARETIASFAKDVLERLDREDESSAAKFSLRWKVEFLIKAFGSVALTPTEQKAADALGIALDSQLGGGV